MPAINAPISNEYNLDSCRNSGTSLELIKCASPSAIAVFPTPDSPTNKGLFLVLRARICIILSSSSTLPINLSTLFISASWFKSIKNSSSVLVFTTSFDSSLDKDSVSSFGLSGLP